MLDIGVILGTRYANVRPNHNLHYLLTPQYTFILSQSGHMGLR